MSRCGGSDSIRHYSSIPCPTTGLIFDEKMLEHKCSWDPGHIECPDRFLGPLTRCKEYGLIERCQYLFPRLATETELMLVHDEKYIEDIKATRQIQSEEELEKFASRYDSVYFNQHTYEAALLSVGSTLQLVSSVLRGEVYNGLAVIRPPGHHAMRSEACGFCFFNNVAIAAKYALEKFDVKKILIVDWDVHHGQATQQIFYDDPRVLYFSIHRYEDGKFWPHLRESNFDYTGSGNGKGFNVNIPLNGIGQGNSEYLAIFNNVLLPMAYEFAPDLVLISAGYDAALGCPEGEMKVTPQAYPHFLNSLAPLGCGRTCVILEGGYCIPSLSESVALSLKSLLGDPCPKIQPSSDINEITVNSILNALSVHVSNWKSLQLQEMYEPTAEAGDNRHMALVNYVGNPLEGLLVYETRGTYPVQLPHVKAAYADEIRDLVAKTDLSLPTYRTGITVHPKAFMSSSNLDTDQNWQFVRQLFFNLSKEYIKSRVVLLIPDDLSVNLVNEYFEGMVIKTLKFSSDVSSNFISTNANASSEELLEKSEAESFLQLVDAVARGACQNGISFAHSPSGSLCNPFYVAVRYLFTSKHKMRRVLILDFNGQGKIADFEKPSDECQVLHISLASGAQVSNKMGYDINIPLSQPSDGDYLAVLFHLILPIAYEFSPEMIMMSSESEMGIASSIMIRVLSGLCNGKVVLACNTPFIDGSKLGIQLYAGLLRANYESFESLKPTSDAIRVIQEVRKFQKLFWRCLKFDVALPRSVKKSRDASAYDTFQRRPSSDPVAIPGINKMFEFEIVSDDVLAPVAYCVEPLSDCPHLELLQPVPNEGLDPKAACQACNDFSENWVCLHCYQVYCGRFINQHMLEHSNEIGHNLALSYSDMSVWCYACDAYIHNAELDVIKRQAENKKFG